MNKAQETKYKEELDRRDRAIMEAIDHLDASRSESFGLIDSEASLKVAFQAVATALDAHRYAMKLNGLR